MTIKRHFRSWEGLVRMEQMTLVMGKIIIYGKASQDKHLPRGIFIVAFLQVSASLCNKKTDEGRNSTKCVE